MITNILLLVMLFLLMAIFFSLQRGFNQVISGLAAVHQRPGEPGGEDHGRKP
jgi:hypothetical protein